MADNFIAKDFFILFFQPQSVIFTLTIPLFQFDDQTDALAFFNALNTVQRLNINNTDTAQFNKISCDVRCCANQLIVIRLLDLNNIIGYKTMTTLNQFQRCLTLTDTAFTGNQNPLTKHIH